MLIPFLGLSLLSTVWFVVNTSAAGFVSGLYYLKLLVKEPYFIVALSNTFVSSGAPALVLTYIFAFLSRNKKDTMGRRKYYTYLFLISLIAPIIITLILRQTFDLINNTIYTLQIGILVVFIHWIMEWVVEKCKKNKARFFASAIFVILMALGITFAILYFTTYLSNTRHIGYLFLSLIGLAEFLLAGLSFACYWKKWNNHLVSVVYILLMVFSVLILLAAMVWLLYFVGIEIAPPPQR